jgi:2',3'-cyclic-nucleotide 2'-phosphodiesterase
MCGVYNSVLGMDPEEPIYRFLTKLPRQRFEPAEGDAAVTGLAVEIDDRTGLAVKVAALRLGGGLSQALPAFWE